MQEIQKSIYSLPEISKRIKPLWTAWILVAIGIISGLIMMRIKNISSGLSSLLIGLVAIGAVALLVILFYYLIGDSKYPYQKEIHKPLEANCLHFAANAEQQILNVLKNNDEEAIANIKQPVQSQLVLFRYSDAEERVIYSQLMKDHGQKWEPITDIFVNKKNV